MNYPDVSERVKAGITDSLVIVALVVGIISLLTVSGNIKKKAIHDYLAGSVVIYAKSESENS